MNTPTPRSILSIFRNKVARCLAAASAFALGAFLHSASAQDPSPLYQWNFNSGDGTNTGTGSGGTLTANAGNGSTTATFVSGGVSGAPYALSFVNGNDYYYPP